jgi:hypothetical protein
MPWKADRGDKLVIYPGEAKGNRPRDIYIDNEDQRQVLDFVKSKIKKTERLGWPINSKGEVASLKSNISKYSKCMTAIGISKEQVKATGHGLRAQYAENAALIAHLIPPTLGGSGGQMDRELLNVKLEQVSELLGHSRISVTTSYYGSFGRDVGRDVADRCKRNIERALNQCQLKTLAEVDKSRLEDCTRIKMELEPLDIEITLPQVQVLWELHSRRFGRDWVKARKGNADAIEAAAISLVKHMKEPKKPEDDSDNQET